MKQARMEEEEEEEEEGGSSLGELRRRCSEVSNCQKFLPSAPPPPPAESNFKYCTVHNDQCALILVYTLSTTNSPQAHYFTCYAAHPKAEQGAAHRGTLLASTARQRGTIL